MLKLTSSLLAPGAAALGLNLLLSVPAAVAAVSHFRAARPRVAVYEDEDGLATKESTEAYSAKIPKSLLVAFTILGLFNAIALAVLDVLKLSEDGDFLEAWFIVALWGFLVFQAIAISLVRDSIRAYNLGVHTFFSSLAQLAVLLYQAKLLAQGRTDIGPPLPFALHIVQIVLIIAVGFASVLIPRRPEVYQDGMPIDAMHTVSVLAKFSFDWVTQLLVFAGKKKKLNLEDLPRMDHKTRAKELSEAWESKSHPKKLWIAMLVEHKWPFILQWILTLIQAFGNFAPQFILLHILRLLERRQPGESVAAEAWAWVVGLFLTTIVASWIEAWLYWLSWAQLAIPIRSQISALIFKKALRRKQVHGVSKKKTKDDEPREGQNLADAPLNDADKPEIDEEDDSDPKGKQSTVNLIGVDAKRVSDFCSFNNYFPGSLFKLIVSFTFLISIIGWKSLLAGFLAMAVTVPINIYFSRKYSDAQDKLMKIRDVKMAVVTEALQGIRQIKFSALEQNWYDKIGKVRSNELAAQWSVFSFDTWLIFCWIASPIALAATSLAVYSLVYGELTPSVAFTAIGVFSNLEVTLAVIPELTTDLIDAKISIERIERYLNSPEVSTNTTDAPSISYENASIAWPSDEEKEEGDQRYVLRDINITFPDKELSVISGKTGSGKSLLLASLFGEVDVLSGKINVPKAPTPAERRDHLANRDNWIIPSSIAFVAQIPWIENASIKDNIIFGLPYDELRYNKVVDACALRKDLDMLTDGEQTEIGANGINLSGGQRWRVTFARALYSRAGILVLDDIFSAVDAHVGRHIFEKGLTGELGAGRTRILVTHHVALCKPKTKYIVELEDGTVAHAGLVHELEEDGTLERIISHDEPMDDDLDADEPTAVNSEEASDGEASEANGAPLKKVDSKKQVKKFVEEEGREKGRVKATVYYGYLKSSGGWPFWSLAFAFFLVLELLILGRAWWLRIWTGNYAEKSTSNNLYSYYSLQTNAFSPFTSTQAKVESVSPAGNNLYYYLGVYIGLSVANAVIGTLRYRYLYYGSIKASKALFNKLCFTVLRTPLRWVDTVPLGRILNRFTADFNVVDGRLANDIGAGGYNILRLLGVIVAGLFVSPWILVLAVTLLFTCARIGLHYLAGAREVKRLESNAKSPVFEQFGSALTGVSTIRAFDKTDVYIKRMFRKIDDHSSTYWHLWAFNRWVGLRMFFVGGFFAGIVAGIILVLPGIDAALAGFALAFALEYSSACIWTIRHYTNLELDMNAAERILEYTQIPTESLEGADPPAAWPSEGKLEVHDLVVGYAPDLPPVLKGLSFSVKQNERIGVVGRTGAGKSSLTLALFRFLEARQGSIHIDGLDISKIKLHALRSRLAIIPQDPVLFSGTVRSNLDAFDQHEDAELRDALERVHLTSASSNPTVAATPAGSTAPSILNGGNENVNIFKSLSSPIAEGGLNLSQGQRQLLCLARAIVSRPKIMVLDEATSAVDMATDALIQRSIREEFGDSTLIVIAHRLSTIADFDKILVLDDGKAVEFGTPKELLEIGPDGIFKGMVEQSGEKEKLEKIIRGE
ncbi:putative ABC bile acid transporter [Xylogone sp. PMI_703]|nr:putative ABC bile acid transporter [Xylogone sp. PMI_703]